MYLTRACDVRQFFRLTCVPLDYWLLTTKLHALTLQLTLVLLYDEIKVDKPVVNQFHRTARLRSSR